MADDDDDSGEDRVIYHPNREEPAAKATRAIVVLLLIVAGVLTLIITAGGWKSLQGAVPVSIAFIIIYFIMAYYVWQWTRGLLPLAAGMSVMLGVFAAIAAFSSGSWFDRDATGYDKHAQLPPALIGLLCVILLPVLALLIAFAMRGFNQKWNIEIEMSREEFEQKYRRNRRGGGGGQAQTA